MTLRVLHGLSQEGKLKYDSLVHRGSVLSGVRSSGAFNSGALMQLRVAWSWFIRGTTVIFSDHLYTARFASRIGAKHIFWAHLIEFDAPLHEMHRRSLYSSLCVVCDSEYTRRHVASLYPATEHKLRVLHLGDQPRDFLDLPLYQHNVRLCNLTMIGRMDATERYKGHDQVLEALPYVLKTFPKCTVKIVGNGSDKTRLQEKAKNLGVADHVAFLGTIDDEALFQIVRESTSLLLPSLREAFGLVYLYAMWAGLPAVAIKGTAANEVLQECGVYAEAQTPEAIAHAIEMALSGEWPYANESQLRYRTYFAFQAFEKRFREFILDEATRIV